MKQFVPLFFVLLLVSALAPASALAAASTTCQTIYGGGEVCPKDIPFSVDKQVMRAGKGGDFVDNLTASDPTYRINDSVPFRVIIKNTGKSKIDKLTAIDTLPQEVTFEGAGNYDDAKKTLTITVDNLESGKSKTINFSAKVISFTSPDAIKCVSNFVRVLDKNGVNVTDSASFCLEKGAPATLPQQPSSQNPQGPQVLAAPNNTKQMPPTGPEDFVLPLLSGAGALGFLLRKKA